MYFILKESSSLSASLEKAILTSLSIINRMECCGDQDDPPVLFFVSYIYTFMPTVGIVPHIVWFILNSEH